MHVNVWQSQRWETAACVRPLATAVARYWYRSTAKLYSCTSSTTGTVQGSHYRYAVQLYSCTCSASCTCSTTHRYSPFDPWRAESNRCRAWTCNNSLDTKPPENEEASARGWGVSRMVRPAYSAAGGTRRRGYVPTPSAFLDSFIACSTLAAPPGAAPC